VIKSIASTLLVTIAGMGVSSAAYAQASGMEEIPSAVADFSSDAADLPPEMGSGMGGHQTLTDALLPEAMSTSPDWMQCQPEIFTESTGTWLKRGFWYTSLEGVVLSRKWERDDINLANATRFNPANIGSIINDPDSALLNGTARPITLDRSGPDAEGMARFTLGRFLFRDVSNRDHNMEFVVFGGGESKQDCFATIEGIRNLTDRTGLFVPFNIDFRNPSFDNADTMTVSYASRFNNFEINYRLSERMRRDRMELQPGGQWVRRANNGWGKEWLAGVRYFDLEENLDWTATNIGTLTSGADGAYRIRTRNNLFGGQLGYGIDYLADRWSVTVLMKHGVYINDARGTYNFTRQDDPNLDFANSGHDNVLSYVGQTSVTGRYHLRPNLSIRAGWEYLYVTSVALAPHQINFNPGYEKVATSGDNFYNGVSFGLDYYW
jgi:hypothetical protein